MDLRGKVAVIIGVGGNTSIGRHVAFECAKQGCNLALVGSDENAVEETVDLAFKSTESPLKISAHVVCGTKDLSGNIDRPGLRQEILQEYEGIDAVIVCGGGGVSTFTTEHHCGPLITSDEYGYQRWEEDMCDDVVSAIRWIRTFLPDIIKLPTNATPGICKSVCLLLTDNSFWPIPSQSSSNCSQAAKKMFMQSLAVECAQLAPHVLVSTASGVVPDWLIADNNYLTPPVVASDIVVKPEGSEVGNIDDAVPAKPVKEGYPLDSAPKETNLIKDPAVFSLYRNADRSVASAAEKIVVGIMNGSSQIIVGNSSKVLNWASSLHPAGCAAAYSPTPKTNGLHWSEQAKIRLMDFAMKRLWIGLCSLPLVLARVLDMPQVQVALKRSRIQLVHLLELLKKLIIKYWFIVRAKALESSKALRERVAKNTKGKWNSFPKKKDVKPPTATPVPPEVPVIHSGEMNIKFQQSETMAGDGMQYVMPSVVEQQHFAGTQ